MIEYQFTFQTPSSEPRCDPALIRSLHSAATLSLLAEDSPEGKIRGVSLINLGIPASNGALFSRS